ncbi:unnamed protein product [Durusdinium trenchii]|uniref:Uncharacterized protein n=1 Tax=Durusdinium trenchii TaxID=1381693 RepID=A0ABP0QIG9_9DINO
MARKYQELLRRAAWIGEVKAVQSSWNAVKGVHGFIQQKFFEGEGPNMAPYIAGAVMTGLAVFFIVLPISFNRNYAASKQRYEAFARENAEIFERQFDSPGARAGRGRLGFHGAMRRQFTIGANVDREGRLCGDVKVVQPGLLGSPVDATASMTTTPSSAREFALRLTSPVSAVLSAFAGPFGGAVLAGPFSRRSALPGDGQVDLQFSRKTREEAERRKDEDEAACGYSSICTQGLLQLSGQSLTQMSTWRLDADWSLRDLDISGGPGRYPSMQLQMEKLRKYSATHLAELFDAGLLNAKAALELAGPPGDVSFLRGELVVKLGLRLAATCWEKLSPGVVRGDDGLPDIPPGAIRVGQQGCYSDVVAFLATMPAYTLPAPRMFNYCVATLMKMDKIIPHEELLAGGELTIFQKSLGKAAFVSHQWVGKGHPDPEFKQMQVLQDALQNLISGTSEVNVDMVTESVYFRSKGIPASEWQEQNLYLWYDYFSCPQAAHVSEQGLQKAISSIPSYVSRSDFFIALCPVLSNPGETETFSEHSWAYRGWCRVERMVYELTFNQGAVNGAEPRRTRSVNWWTPGWTRGMFTVESDRERIGVVLAKLVKGKLLFCLENMELPHYRFLLNQQTSILRGLPVKPIEDVVPGFEGEDVLERFMSLSAVLGNMRVRYQNGFQNPFDYDSAGWSPMCYACMKGDVSLVAALLKQRVDPNEKIKKARAEINLDKGCSLIHICARFRNHEAMQVLFAANAAVNVQGIPHSPVGVAAMENDPIGIRLLCSVSADPRKKNLGVSSENRTEYHLAQ